MATLITANRADTCRAETCTQQSREIRAGEQINYGGYQAVTHADCPPMDAPRTSRSTGRSSRRSYRPRYRGRCEDAPCCGCCD